MAHVLKESLDYLRAPRFEVNLRLDLVEGVDPFYAKVAREFHRQAICRHPKFPLVRRLQVGVALCPLPREFDAYFMGVEAAGRRNFKKALRNSYTVQRINYNDYLTDIGAVRASSEFRQGAMPDHYLSGAVNACQNPPPLTATHDYPYWGVLKEGKLVAYAGVMIAGELAMIEHILGHAAYQGDGVVPMLLIGMAGDIMKHYPCVKYYGYGSYFGAGETMRRFKRKFGFLPCRVKWVTG